MRPKLPIVTVCFTVCTNEEEGRRKKEEGKRKKGKRKKEEGIRKKKDE
ncbi:MAG: hypothetical protein HC786_22350 [Richelia sp. CSU_2_1]|nr:hypothetical protein [Richelia sp. CSU_2_1]